MGDAWTYVAFDPDTKLVPSFITGKRNEEATQAFIGHLAERMHGKVQVSTDGLKMYVSAIGTEFLSRKGADYAQIIKTYESEPVGPGRYNPPKISRHDQDADLRRTQDGVGEHVGVWSGTTSRLAWASAASPGSRTHGKKLENHGASVALWFAYYNFVRVHRSVETTPAVAAGVTDHEWELEELVEAAHARTTMGIWKDHPAGGVRAQLRAQGLPVPDWRGEAPRLGVVREHGDE